MRRRLTEAEGIIWSDRGLLFLDAADVGPSRAAIEEAGQFGQPGRGPDGVDFDTSIVEVASVPCESEFDGGALGEVTKADTLDAAADVPAPGFYRLIA
jgi:hypothetical protein